MILTCKPKFAGGVPRVAKPPILEHIGSRCKVTEVSRWFKSQAVGGSEGSEGRLTAVMGDSFV
jgi:hypothetical protein